MPAPQSPTNLALERRAEEKALGDLATWRPGYRVGIFYGSTQDHADTMSATCKWAIIFGFEPAACWVLTPVLAAKRPTHAVAFHKGTSPLFLVVITDGARSGETSMVSTRQRHGVHAG